MSTGSTGTPQHAGAEGGDRHHALRAYLDRHQVIALATVDQDGLPHVTALPYRRDGDDLYVLVDPASRVAANLREVGPVAGAVIAADEGGARGLELTGAAEAVDDPAEAARIAAAFPARGVGDRPPASWRVYRIVPDDLRLGDERAAAGLEQRAAAGPLPQGLEEQTATAGEVIVRQGQPADRFYVIVAGECEVVRDTGSGRQVLARLGPGRFFGETGLLAGVPRTATIVAVDTVRLSTLSRANFRAALGVTALTAEELARRIYEGAGQ